MRQKKTEQKQKKNRNEKIAKYAEAPWNIHPIPVDFGISLFLFCLLLRWVLFPIGKHPRD